ncbi:cytochrome P450 [Propioniferax innocua]|uniref:Cytochrome P450 n=1 Tax=Propioniferax innocua TaxID=1753 RepID=A0A542ZAF2_9ACTN|nr:cytochrome P450 [Propioniferax innocua]TQL57322.1 cytochrome P450 [Propioniferax innocua]
MLTTDGAEQARLRAPAQALLGPAAVATMRPQIARSVEASIDSVVGNEGPVDKVLADHTAAAALAAVLTTELSAKFLQMVRASRLVLNPLPQPALRLQTVAASTMVDRWTTSHVATLADVSEPQCPAERFATDPRLSSQEKAATMGLCIIGGFSPLTDLVTSGLMLARDPELRSKMLEAPTAFLEELVRWQSPVPFAARQALQDIDLPSGTVRGGQRCLVHLGAANHDPEQFENPSLFDPSREQGRPLGFGHGAHYCMGAALTRIALPTIWTAMLDRWHEFVLEGDSSWTSEPFPRRMRPAALRWAAR